MVKGVVRCSSRLTGTSVRIAIDDPHWAFGE
jgi:hypothetical protein